MMEFLSIEDHPAVQQAQAQLEAKRQELASIRTEVEEAEDLLEDAEQEIVEIEAHVSIGDAEPSEAQAAQSRAQEARKTIEDRKKAEAPLARAVQILDQRLDQAREQASVELQEAIDAAYQEESQALIAALETAEKHRRRLDEIRDVVGHRPNNVSAPGSNIYLRSVGVQPIRGNISHQPLEALK